MPDTFSDSPLAAAVRVFAVAKRFTAATVDHWLRLDGEDQITLLRLAERLRLGENQFRALLDWAEEIAVRDRCTIKEVWAREPVASTLARQLGRNEMIAAVKSALRVLRFPQLAAAEARLAELVRQLKLPHGVRVVLPEQLEGDEVRVELRGRSAEGLRACVAAVQRALGRPELDELFRTLEQVP